MTIKHELADTTTEDTTPSVQDAQETHQEPQNSPENTATQDDTVEPPKAADEAENTPEKDAEEDAENTSEEDASEMDTLKEKYAALEAKLAELEAKEAARLEAEAKTEALTNAGIKGDYGQLLHGDQETWDAQIAALKAFAAENAPAMGPARRDPALDADMDDYDEDTRSLKAFINNKTW